jgi:glyoxylase-like metal-dependent hydrolase (beta-lactamase superfamily II)
MAANTQLIWKNFPAGEHGFFRAPVLISGARDAVLIDGGFALPDGKALAEAIKSSGKKLTTMYISQSDPDYYFSLAPIKSAFPEARVIAASATIAAIKGNVEKKLAIWGCWTKMPRGGHFAALEQPAALVHEIRDFSGRCGRSDLQVVVILL